MDLDEFLKNSSSLLLGNKFFLMKNSFSEWMMSYLAMIFRMQAYPNQTVHMAVKDYLKQSNVTAFLEHLQ